MQDLNHPVLKVYRSSAGSGKTFTLVKEYLTLVFKSSNPYSFKQILAITFTNKAADEMKSRILEVLEVLSKKQKNKDELSLLEIYSTETKIDKKNVELKAEKILSKILHNYSDFSVFTIDKFTHRLIRSFSRELGLSLNFNVELNEKEFLENSIKKFLSKVGDDKILSDFLKEFIDQSLKRSVKSNVVAQLSAFQRLLLKGNRDDKLKLIKHLPIGEFSKIRSNLFTELTQLENSNQKLVKSCLQKLEENQISDDFFHFKKKRFPKLYKVISNKDVFSIKNVNNWEAWVQEGKWIGKVSEQITIEKFKSIVPYLEEKTVHIIENSKRIVYLKEILRYLTSYSLINQLVNEIEHQKKINGVLLISDFNRLISEIIIQEPAAFIFERIGNRYRHFLFDEFQDTSVRQWNNLVPLVHESLSTGGINLLVGDAKQAIYRWREGDVSQFINLPTIDQGIPNSKEINHSFKSYYNSNELVVNRRSFAEIIQFNNDLFSRVVNDINLEFISKAYENNNQEFHRPSKGYIEISIHDKEEREQQNRLNYLLDVISKCIENGYSYSDIAVIVRKNKQATMVAEFLSAQTDPIIPVLSGESIVLSSSVEVGLILNFLKAFEYSDNHAKLFILNYLNDSSSQKDYSVFFERNKDFYRSINLKKVLNAFSISFDFMKYECSSLMQKIYLIVAAFNINKLNPYLTQFLSSSFDYIQTNGSSIAGFLDFFETETDRISVDVGSENAVNVISIHKSKGLQFPVVVIPFGSWLDKEGIQEDFDWIEGEDLETIGLNSFICKVSETSLENLNRKKLFEKEKEQLLLDNINLYYVAFTRAQDRLYVSLDEPPKSANSKVHIKHYISKQVVSHEKYDEGLKKLIFGKENTVVFPIKKNHLIADIPVETKSLVNEVHLSLDNQRTSFQLNKDNFFGTILHKVMEKVEHDFSKAFSYLDDLKKTKMIDADDFEKLNKSLAGIESSKELFSYFTKKYMVYNEIELIDGDGNSFRIDRLVVDECSTCVVIDYKTSEPMPKDVKQIQTYMTLLEDANYSVSHGILIYFPDLRIEKISNQQLFNE